MENARARVRRGTLNRERIVDAAIDLIDTHGLRNLTMPRLAQRLNVGTMSLYRHVAGKDDLLDAIADRIFARLEVPPGSPDDWIGRVVGYLIEWRQVATAHPALAEILAGRALHLERVYSHLEVMLQVLLRAGFPDPARAFYALFTYVFGFVIWELPRSDHDGSPSYRAAQTEAIDDLTEGYDLVKRCRDRIADAAGSDQFAFGLDLLVQSLHMRMGTSTPSTEVQEMVRNAPQAPRPIAEQL